MIVLVVLMLAWIGVSSILRNIKNEPKTATTTATATASEVCTDNKRLQAPAYHEGSHQPMALFARSSAAADHYQGIYVLGTAPTSTTLHDAYTVVGQNLTTTYSDKKTPVLVGCITRTNETPTTQTCDYDDGKRITVYNAAYHLTVYEARSRRVLSDVAVPSISTYVCTSFTTYDGKGFYRAWDTAMVATTLYPLAQ